MYASAPPPRRLWQRGECWPCSWRLWVTLNLLPPQATTPKQPLYCLCFHASLLRWEQLKIASLFCLHFDVLFSLHFLAVSCPYLSLVVVFVSYFLVGCYLFYSTFSSCFTHLTVRLSAFRLCSRHLHSAWCLFSLRSGFLYPFLLLFIVSSSYDCFSSFNFHAGFFSLIAFPSALCPLPNFSFGYCRLRCTDP